MKRFNDSLTLREHEIYLTQKLIDMPIEHCRAFNMWTKPFLPAYLSRRRHISMPNVVVDEVAFSGGDNYLKTVVL